MARIPMFDPLTSEARSPLIAGLTEACNKLSSVLDLKIEQAYDMPLSNIYITDNNKYSLYQAPLGNKLWLESPAPIIRKNGIVITPETDEFTIDYFGGSIKFDNNKQLEETDIITADFTYIIDGSNTLSDIIDEIEAVGLNANKFRGYYNDIITGISTVTNPVGGDYFIVGGTENNIYIWNSTTKKWEPVHKQTDLSNYYTKTETNSLLNTKEDIISPYGTTLVSDDYYYGGRKTWQNINDKVQSVPLTGIDTSNTGKVTGNDDVLTAIGKLQGQINDYVHDLFGSADPTTTTIGQIGQDYTNTSTGAKFHLTEIATNGDYIWTPYQEELEMDDTPTSGSSNPVTSDGIYTALSQKADKVIPTKPGNLVTLDANGNIVDSGKGVGDVGKLPTIQTITILSTGWTESTISDKTVYVQTVSVIGAIANENDQIVTVSPNPIESNINQVTNSAVYCTMQGAGTLTFTAFESRPTDDIVFNVILQNL